MPSPSYPDFVSLCLVMSFLCYMIKFQAQMNATISSYIIMV